MKEAEEVKKVTHLSHLFHLLHFFYSVRLLAASKKVRRAFCYDRSIAIFLALVGKLAPLYVVIGLGWFAGKRLKVQGESIARVLIYILSPAVIFHSVLALDLRPSLLLLPGTFFVLCIATCLLAYAVASLFWTDAHRNILAFACGTGNTGYFGLPVAIALFGEKSAGLMVLGSLGALLFESTLGYFLVARGRHTAGESFRRLLRLPAPYACAAGLAINAFHPALPGALNDMFVNMRGAYSVAGSLMVGLGLSSVDRIRIDRAFTLLAFSFKFLLWPFLMFLAVSADRAWTGYLGEDAHRILLLLSIVPIAANTVAFATDLRAEPAKAATTVFLSTAFALVYIPLMVAILF